MYPDRIDPTYPCAANLTAPNARGHDARVVGLGAPLSVRIRLEPCEQAPLRRHITRRARALPAPDISGTTRPARQEAAPVEAQAWREMLAQLADSGDVQPVAVLWPTALAVPALRGALADTLGTIESCPRGDSDLAALNEALATAFALIQTLRALLAVDNGGLPDLAL